MNHALHVSLAAHLSNDVFNVRLLYALKAGEPRLALSLTPRTWYGGPANTWATGGWNTPAVWQEPDINPWDACSFWSEIEPAAPARRQGLFGKAQTPVDFRTTLAEMCANPSGAAIIELISKYGSLNEISDGSRGALLEFLRANLNTLKVEQRLDGDEPTLGEGITLAYAQGLTGRLFDRKKLDASDVAHADMILRMAPLAFGYWGTFKALLKYANPEQLPDAFAVALRRISGTEPMGQLHRSDGFEDVSLLQNFGQVPSMATAAYMGRRMRRAIRTIGERNPSLYVQICRRLLDGWRAPLNSQSYVPMYVMFGEQPHMADHSYRVSPAIDPTFRSEPHADVWDEHLDDVAAVFESTPSPVVMSWAFNILTANSREVAIKPDRMDALLLYVHPGLRSAACRQLARIEGEYPLQYSQSWCIFFSEAQDDDFGRVCEQLLRSEASWTISVAVDTMLVDFSRAIPAERLLMMARIFVATPRAAYMQNEQPTGVAVEALAKAFGLSPASEWRPVLERLQTAGLLNAYLRLIGVAAQASARALIADVIVQKVRDAPVYSWMGSPNEVMARELLLTGDAEAAALGWRILEHAQLKIARITWLLAWAGESDRVPDATFAVAARALLATMDEGEFAQAVLELATSPRISALGGFVALIEQLTAPGPAVWSSLAGADSSELTEQVLASEALARATEDWITHDRIKQAGPQQLAMVLRCIQLVPERIQDDPEFGITCATALNADLQAEALMQLQRHGLLPKVWLRLAESAMPRPVRTAASYVRSIKDPAKYQEAVLACLDSPVAATRDMGLELLDGQHEVLVLPAIWNALSESEDPAIQARVAEEALVGEPVEESKLASFDRRLLMTRRGRRSTKESVKSRLEEAPEPMQLHPDRMHALLDMARAANTRDREWALQRLAQLAMHGVAIEDVRVSPVTGGVGE